MLNELNIINTESTSNLNGNLLNKHKQLYFGVDSKIPATDLLQNNLNMFEWVSRNKVYPIFWGRYITGENSLTQEEAEFFHNKKCKIALIGTSPEPKISEEDGRKFATKVLSIVSKLNIPSKTVIFLEFDDNEALSKNYMRGYAIELLVKGYIPGFKANTDSVCCFNREFCRGLQKEPLLFQQCPIWAVAPTLDEYNEATDSHILHPNYWKPYAPSGITRNEIAIWQYGKNCHRIFDDNDIETSFNVNITQNNLSILEKLF